MSAGNSSAAGTSSSAATTSASQSGTVSTTSASASASTVSTSSASRTWYVAESDPNASDATPITDPAAGSAARPFRTLTRALQVVSAGEAVIVKPGRYTDPNATWYSAFTPTNSGTSGAPITIKSDPPLQAVLVPRDYSATAPNRYPALSIYQKRYIVVDGFKAEGMLKIHHDESPIVSQYVTIQNCEVEYGSQQGDDASLNWGIAIHVSNHNVLRNNRVHNLRSSGNNSENTGAFMLFAGSHNLIENNDADAGNGVVFSAFGQKAGNISNNVWRRNIARNATAGFIGKGGTSGSSYSDNETFHENIIINAERAFHLNHNSRYWRVYNNTAYNVRYFMNQWQLSSVDNQFWNNLVVSASSGVYQIEDLTSPSWSPYISYSNHNFFSSVASTFARWQYGASSYSLSQWVSGTGHDTNSLTGDPMFVSTTPGSYDFRLQPGSPAKGRGRNEEDIGAYPVGNEVIGYRPP
jgi:hypothetical protein